MKKKTFAIFFTLVRMCKECIYIFGRFLYLILFGKSWTVFCPISKRRPCSNKPPNMDVERPRNTQMDE